ncbi:MAG: nucleotidyltransferase family protein [Gemmatimonadota bacterium]
MRALNHNVLVSESLRRLESLNLPNWYLGAGCVAQTVWNVAHSRSPNAGIDDYDIVYFDPDLSAAAESQNVSRVRELLSDLPVRSDVKNQARVHLWYAARFGYEIRPYTSCQDAIATWPTTATAIGVRWVDTALLIEAPFGTADLLGLIVRANRVQITSVIYAAKIDRWTRQWPLLRVLSWEDGVGEPGIRRAGSRSA